VSLLLAPHLLDLDSSECLSLYFQTRRQNFETIFSDDEVRITGDVEKLNILRSEASKG
jgi:hypothetical protein